MKIRIFLKIDKDFFINANLECKKEKISPLLSKSLNEFCSRIETIFQNNKYLTYVHQSCMNVINIPFSKSEFETLLIGYWIRNSSLVAEKLNKFLTF